MGLKEDARKSLTSGRTQLTNARTALDEGDVTEARVRAVSGREHAKKAVEQLKELETGTPPPDPEPEPEPEPEPTPSGKAEFFAPDSPFNKPVASDAWSKGKAVADLVKHGSGKTQGIYVPFNSGDWSHPIFFAKASDPLKEVKVDNPSWGGFNQNGKKIHVPANAKQASGGDAHIVIVQPEDGAGDFPGQAFGFYDVRSLAGPITATSCGYSHAKTGSGTDKGNITAAGFNGAAGMILAKDIERGEIPHALFGVLNCSCATAVPPAQPNTTAVKCGSSRYSRVNCGSVSNWPGMGSRLVLDPSYDISKFPKGQRMILAALQKYGVLIGDTGGYSQAFIFGSLAEGVNSGGSVLRAFCEQAKSEGWGSGSGDYSLDFGKGVDWSKLRLVA